MALSAEDKKEVSDLIAAGNKALLESDGYKSATTDLVTTAVGQATTKLTETVNGLAESVKKIGEAAPAGGGKGDDKKGEGKKDDAEPPAWAKMLIDANKKNEERLAAMDAEKSKAAETATRTALIEKTLTDEKYSALAKHKTFVRDLHARGVTKPEEVKAALAEFIADQKVLGVEIKPTAASPAGEGAKPGAGSGGDGKTLSIEEKTARLKQIAKNTGPVPVGSSG